MKISNLRLETVEGGCRAVADVAWEDSDRPRSQLTFQTTPEWADALEPNPEAFLTACVPVAARHRERRVRVEGAVSPRLRDGLLAASHTMRQWYGTTPPVPAIESDRGFTPGAPAGRARVVSMMSGGVDSLATLRANRLDYPSDHPGAVRECLIIHGLNSRDFGDAAAERLAQYWRTVDGLGAVGRDAQVRLVPLVTNYRTIDPDYPAWAYKYHGAALAAAAHLFSGRFTRQLIPSSYDVQASLRPWGSHPMTDPWYSSDRLEVQHHLAHLRRIDKVRLLADWEVGLQNIRACFWIDTPNGQLNCGRCDKCLRTMLELAAVGRLGHTAAFPSELTADMLHEDVIGTFYHKEYFLECVDLLAARGRDDLVRAVRRAIAAYDASKRVTWKARLRAFDQRHTGGRLMRLKEALVG
ncbi:MAG TPA: hypothetical protein VF136_05710 [Methylomirabilota bacterium]